MYKWFNVYLLWVKNMIKANNKNCNLHSGYWKSKKTWNSADQHTEYSARGNKQIRITYLGILVGELQEVQVGVLWGPVTDLGSYLCFN